MDKRNDDNDLVKIVGTLDHQKCSHKLTGKIVKSYNLCASDWNFRDWSIAKDDGACVEALSPRREKGRLAYPTYTVSECAPQSSAVVLLGYRSVFFIPRSFFHVFENFLPPPLHMDLIEIRVDVGCASNLRIFVWTLCVESVFFWLISVGVMFVICFFCRIMITCVSCPARAVCHPWVRPKLVSDQLKNSFFWWKRAVWV